MAASMSFYPDGTTRQYDVEERQAPWQGSGNFEEKENGRRGSHSTWGTWSYSYSAPGWNSQQSSHRSFGSNDDSEGSWWYTPQMWVWGKTLDSAIEYAISRKWIVRDRAFCAWEAEVHKRDEPANSEVEDESIPMEANRSSGLEEDEAGESVEAMKGKKAYTGKEHIPEHDGKITMREYERRVRLFQSTSSISPEYQAGKLLERLQGEAWRAAETLEIQTLKHKDGVQLLLDHLWGELEPLEFLRVFQTLSFFYEQFQRERGQEFTSFDTAFRSQCQRLAEAQAPLEGRAKAFWFLKKANISEELRRQVVSSAGGVYDYQKLRAALVAIVPQVRKQENQEGAKPRGRSPGPPSYANKVHAVLEGGEPEEEGEESLGIDDLDLELEAEVLLTHAARKRSEAAKNRGFARSESPRTRDKRISEMKSRMPCAACKAAGKLVYGHWHSDPDCPQKGQTPAGHKDAKPVFMVTQPDADGADSDEASEDAFFVGVIFMASAERLRKASACLALTDTCCARTVAGDQWAQDTLERLARTGTPFFHLPRCSTISVW